MGQNKSVYSIEFKGILTDLQDKLTTAQKGLNQLGNNDATKLLKDRFGEIAEQLIKIERYSGQSLNEKGFKKLADEASIVDRELEGLLNSFKEIKYSSDANKEGFFFTRRS